MASSPTTPSEKVAMGGDEKVMKDLMQEANKMLQSLSPAAKTGDTKQARLKEQKETTGYRGYACYERKALQRDPDRGQRLGDLGGRRGGSDVHERPGHADP